jgi:hypothetical protein
MISERLVFASLATSPRLLLAFLLVHRCGLGWLLSLLRCKFWYPFSCVPKGPAIHFWGWAALCWTRSPWVRLLMTNNLPKWTRALNIDRDEAGPPLLDYNCHSWPHAVAMKLVASKSLLLPLRDRFEIQHWVWGD